MASRPDISIVICTFQRTDLLETAVVSCLSMERPEGIDYEILVVDNCPGTSAKNLIDDLKARHGGAEHLRYFSDPRTNISHARNTGVANAAGTYIAFIDDDNIVPADWLFHVFDVIARTDAKMVLGDVEAVFESDAPEDVAQAIQPWMRREAPFPDEKPIPIKSWGHIPGARTCNVILHRETCFPKDIEWFDPAFGRTGGEDTDYFMRLGRILKPGDAIRSSKTTMKETCPNTRVDEDYVVQRFFKGAQIYTRARMKNSRQPFLTRLEINLIGSVQSILRGGRLGILKLTHGGRAPITARIAYAMAAGKLVPGAMLRNTGPYR